jgi:hypothetical protein
MPLEITGFVLQLMAMNATTVFSKPPHLSWMLVRECLPNQCFCFEKLCCRLSAEL